MTSNSSNTPVLDTIASLLKDVNALVSFANGQDHAYNTAVGTPEAYQPFDMSNPVVVAQNLAGLPALLGGLQIYAYCVVDANTLKEVEYAVLDGLWKIANSNLLEINTMASRLFSLCANMTWAAQQPALPKPTPMARGTRMNVYALLPAAEQDKDVVQIKAAAQWLLNQLTAAGVIS
jgi:hypothetical protein